MNRSRTLATLFILAPIAAYPLEARSSFDPFNLESPDPPFTSKCDLNGDGSTNVTDVQLIINEALGLAPPNNDLNNDGVVNVADVQIVINAALGLGCSADTPPTISFFAIPNQFLGISPFPVSAAAISGGAVGFTSTTPAVCKTAGDLVTLKTAGTCSIRASQAGNSSGAITRSFSVEQAKPSATFTAATGSPLTAGTNPNSIASGDFNGDGIPDLALANTTSNNVSVLLGNGSGGFTPAANSPFSVAGGPVAVAVGDFNGDGVQDLAVANLNGNNLAVLLGNGSGGFTAATGSPFAVGTNPDFVAIGDFNGDGIEDIAVSNLNSNNVTVLIGNGSGGFAAATGSPLTVGTSPQSIVVGDFNGDDMEDLAIANYSGSITVLLGSGTGGFTQVSGSPFAVPGNSSSLVGGDFSGDGFEDLAVASYNTGTITVLLGNGSGGFAAAGTPVPVGTGRGVIVVADFNGDAIQDLAVVNGNSNNVTVLLGNGSGGFAATSASPFPNGTEPVSLVAEDFNQDGIEDLAIVNLLSSNVTVLLGNAVNGFAAALSSPQPPSNMVAPSRFTPAR